jgi:hypothetical protein
LPNRKYPDTQKSFFAVGIFPVAQQEISRHAKSVGTFPIVVVGTFLVGCVGTPDEQDIGLFVTERAAVSATYSLAQQPLLSYNRLTASIAITASMAVEVRNVRLG